MSVATRQTTRRIDRDGVRGALASRARQFWVTVRGQIDAHRGRYADPDDNILRQGMDLVGAILTVVIAGVAAFVGINIMSSTRETTALQQGDAFYNSSNALVNGVQDFFTQMPTVFTVIALVLVISYLTIIRGGR